jgi:dUTP pyrophosphatase
MSALQPPAQIAPSIAAAASAQVQLQVLLLSEHATAPTKGSPYAAGHDLYAAKDVVIQARGRALVPTDISISVPVGTCEFANLSTLFAYTYGFTMRWN